MEFTACGSECSFRSLPPVFLSTCSPTHAAEMDHGLGPITTPSSRHSESGFGARQARHHPMRSNSALGSNATMTTTQELTNQIVTEIETARIRHRHKMQGLIYRIAESNSFEAIIGFVIVLNAAIIGVNAEFDFENDGAAGERFSLITTWFFAASYSIEFVIKLLAYGCKVYFMGQDRGSNFMDFCLTVVGVVEAFLLTVAEAGTMKNALVLRMFRVVRFLRLLRMVRAFRQLQLFMAALLDAFKVVIWGILLTMLVIYMAAVYTKTLMEGHLDDKNARDSWGSLSVAMYSYFRITTLDDWAEVTEPVLKVYPYMSVFFIIFICITAFAFINVMTAVVVESVLARALANNAEAESKASEELKAAIRSIYEAFSHADLDNDQMLSRAEFHAGLSNHNIKRALLNAEISLEDVDELFDVLDHQGTGQLTLEEFMEGCLRGRGVAKGKDLLLVACDLRRYMTGLFNLLRQVLEQPRCQGAIELEAVSGEAERDLSRSQDSEHSLQNGESPKGKTALSSDLSLPVAARPRCGALPNGFAESSFTEPSSNRAGGSDPQGTSGFEIMPDDQLVPQDCVHESTNYRLGCNPCTAVPIAQTSCIRCKEIEARAERAEAEVRQLKLKMRTLLAPMQDLAREIEYL